MSIWVKMEVTEGMKNHVRGYLEMFYGEVVEKASMSYIDLAVLFFLMRSKRKYDWWALTRGLGRSYSSVMKSIKKLRTLGLVKQMKRKGKETVYYYDKGEEM